MKREEKLRKMSVMRIEDRVVEEEKDVAFDSVHTMVNFIEVMVVLKKENHGNWRMLLDLLDDMKRYFNAQDLIIRVVYSGGTSANVIIHKGFKELIQEDWIISKLIEAFPELYITNMFD